MNPSAQDLLPMRNRLVTGVLTFGRCATDLSSLLNIYRHASPMIGRLGQRSPRNWRSSAACTMTVQQDSGRGCPIACLQAVSPARSPCPGSRRAKSEQRLSASPSWASWPRGCRAFRLWPWPVSVAGQFPGGLDFQSVVGCRADDRSRPSRGRSACAGVDRPPLRFGRRGPTGNEPSRPLRAKSRQERPRADLRVLSVARAAPLDPLRPRLVAGAARSPSGLPCRDARRGWSGDPPWSNLSCPPPRRADLQARAVSSRASVLAGIAMIGLLGLVMVLVVRA